MAYIKNHDPWTASDPILTTDLDNFETIYTEMYSYLASHNHNSLYYTITEMLAKFWGKDNDGSGSGADADLIYKSDGNLHAASFTGLGVPTGLIIMWSGALSSIPSGWHLCDGTSGTIDLRDKFVIGAGNVLPGTYSNSKTFEPVGTITVNNHTLTIGEIPSHLHYFYDSGAEGGAWPGYAMPGTVIAGTTNSGGDFLTYTGTTGSTGGGQGHNHEGNEFIGDPIVSLPFYYAIAFIQKI